MFAVTVTFKLKPGHAPAFLPLIHDNAATSLRTEPGCQQFDVATNPDAPETVFLYELYTDAAALEAHKATDHFALFDAACTEMVADKEIRTFTQVTQ